MPPELMPSEVSVRPLFRALPAPSRLGAEAVDAGGRYPLPGP